VYGIVAGGGDPADVPARGDRSTGQARRRRGLRLVPVPPGRPLHHRWMLVAPSPVEAIPLMSPPAVTDRSPAAGTPGPAAALPASAVAGVSRLAHQVPAAPTAPAVTVANAAATAQRSDVACGIHDQEANRNSHRHPPNTATVTVTATSHRINRIAS